MGIHDHQPLLRWLPFKSHSHIAVLWCCSFFALSREMLVCLTSFSCFVPVDSFWGGGDESPPGDGLDAAFVAAL